jgi:fucose permease
MRSPWDAMRVLARSPLGRPWRSVVGVFAIHAAVSGSLGPRLPAIKEQAGLSVSGLGVALVGFAVGLFVGTRLANLPLQRHGNRAVLRVGTPLFAVSLIGSAAAHSLVTLTIALVVLGTWAGLLDVAMNANAVAVERGAGRPIMSGIHGVWSAGLLVASGAAVLAAAIDASPLEQFTVVGLALAVSSIPLTRGLLDERIGGAETHRPRRTIRSGPWSEVFSLGVIGFCSFLAEGAMNDWSAVYLNGTLAANSAVAALGVTGFALGMTVSRFVADGLSVRFGPVSVVRTGGLAAAVGLAFGLLIPAPAAGIAGFTILGAALAPVVPTVFSAAGNLGGGASALGWVVTISYVGGILGPALLGFVARQTGLRTALAIPVGLAVVIAALAGTVGSAQSLNSGAKAAPSHAG